MWNWLKGKKSYLLGLAAIAYAVAQWSQGAMDADAAIKLMFEALGLMGLRNGITTENAKTPPV